MNLIVFAIVAYIFYRVFKSYRQFERCYYSKEYFKDFTLTKEALRQSELGLFVALMAKVAKADGRVHELEAELVSNMLRDISAQFPDPQLTKNYLKEIFNEEKQIKYNIDDIASALYMQIRNDKRKAIMMLSFLVHLSFIDGEFSHAEERIVTKIAAFLHVNANELASILAQFQQTSGVTPQSSLKEAYELLGVSKSASLQEVKKAYRKAVKKYHPDLMKAQGKDENYIAKATQKVQQINAAYEMIKKVKG